VIYAFQVTERLLEEGFSRDFLKTYMFNAKELLSPKIKSDLRIIYSLELSSYENSEIQ